MPLNDFLLFLLVKVCTSYVPVKVCTSCSCSMANTAICLVAHKLHQIHMNNQGKFTARSNKLKVKIHGKLANDIIVSR